MPTLLNAYICSRCWQRLTRATTNQSFKQFREAYHSSPTHDQGEAAQVHETQESSPKLTRRIEELRNGRKSERPPQGWRALLRNKSLGEAASVLVLRDTEAKIRGRRPQTKEQGFKQDMNRDFDSGKILSFLKNQKLDPEQAEVKTTIDLLRPDARSNAPGRQTAISQQDYERILKQLSDGFNQTQLARYITSSLDDVGILESPETSQPVFKRDGIKFFEWRSIHPAAGSSTKSKQRGATFRGKKGLADSIFRSIWKLNVQEEVEGSGTMDICVDPIRLSTAVFGDKHSELTELGRLRNVKIEVSRSKGLIQVFATKAECSVAAKEIETIFQEPISLKLDLRPLKLLSKEKSLSFLKELVSIAAKRSECTLDIAPRFDTVTVRARKRSLIDRFQRLLLGSFEFRPLSRDVCLSNQEADQKGLMVAVPSDFSHTSTSLPDLTYGRFVLPFTLAPGEHGAPKQIIPPKRMPATLFNEVREHLEQSAVFGTPTVLQGVASSNANPESPVEETQTSQWTKVPRTRFSAKFGNLLYQMPTNEPIQTMQSGHLVNGGHEAPVLAPSMSGLPMLLEQQLDNAISTAKSETWTRDYLGFKKLNKRLDVRFVPSPWNISRAALRGIPSLDLGLVLSHKEERPRIRSLRAIMGTRCANIILPNFGMDLQLVRSDVLNLDRPEMSVSLQEFVTRLLKANPELHTQHVVDVSLTITLPIPITTLIPGAVKSDPRLSEALASHDSEVMVDFVAVSHQVLSTLSTAYGPHDLEYKHLLDDDFGRSWETVELHRDVQHADNGDKADWGHEVLEFWNAAQDFYRNLNIGMGKIHRVGSFSRKVEAAKEASKVTERPGA